MLESIWKCPLGRKVVWVAEAKTPRAKGMADIAHILQILANKKLPSFATKFRKFTFMKRKSDNAICNIIKTKNTIVGWTNLVYLWQQFEISW